MPAPRTNIRNKPFAYATYKITFHCEGVGQATAFLDETPITMTGGYGGWTVVSRQRRTGLTMWQGKDPLRLSIPILFDGYANNIGVEMDISRLSRMALPVNEGLTAEPPLVTIEGKALPRPGPKFWVVENLQWGTNVIYDFDDTGKMSRLRQDCVVNLMQYVAGDRASFGGLSPTKAGGSKAKPGSKGFQKPRTVKAGDSLSKIANSVYKNPGPNDWKLIAKANGIRDPRHISPGQKLKIPKK